MTHNTVQTREHTREKTSEHSSEPSSDHRSARSPGEPPIQRHWWAKTIAGAVLGLSLGIATGGVYSRFSSGPPMLTSQIAMWMVAPVWMTVLSLVFLFRNGWRAWAWLLAANAAAFAALFIGRPLPTF
ncbi:hypothetical protein SAMN05216359_106232 [Roseateles sp. YR242]|uniref:DUF4134 domain-containing protein n=1 Tax=Roseateles sp. YR242 TaxID=1855305 RepID=UPI0008C98D7D|nr:DUF4134 domain-containing protein [Roseateles sp. YR242]SEL22764.1 hypothetical protein SAMN05216359_106232 [Roseateles sp. YR242]